jgi:hypothetical protein
LIDVLLANGEGNAAWQVPRENPNCDPDAYRWMCLAQAREPSAPGDALNVYLRLSEIELEATGRDGRRTTEQ